MNKKAGPTAETEITEEQADLPRKPINEGMADEREANQFGAVPLGQPRNLDADRYIAKYPGRKLMWVNDIGGDVQRWIDAGAEPVPRATAGKVFEGLTDVTESKWERAIGGDDGSGNSFWVYLLVIDEDIYDRVHLAPERARQKAIDDAMRGGVNQSDEGQVMRQGGRIETYAPNLPTGTGRGLEVER